MVSFITFISFDFRGKAPYHIVQWQGAPNTFRPDGDTYRKLFHRRRKGTVRVPGRKQGATAWLRTFCATATTPIS